MLKRTSLALSVIICMLCFCSSVQSASKTESEDFSRLLTFIKMYSKQCVFSLDPGESYRITLKNGVSRTITLISVDERRDSVINLIRSAKVLIKVDGHPLMLTCAPYTMPTLVRGIRIVADTTSGWVDMPKRVQFSVWDAADPIVDTSRFGFPIRNYRLFSHGIQAFNEPVHLGLGDGDPAGQKFYHSYGMDMAGFESGEDVLSATDGEVIGFWPSREDLCSVIIQDDGGFVWEYAHLASTLPDIVVGAHVKRGQQIGILGKSGPSGNFSHLHLGSYLSRADMEVDHRNMRLNLYLWLVAAYQAAHPKSVFAVARPHQTVLTGEKVILDGSNSLAFGTKIAAWRWELPDGRTVRKPVAEIEFDKPGSYVATLWIKGKNGVEDVDFCHVRVFSRGKPEESIPTIFMSCTPTENVRVGQPVSFRCWMQSQTSAPIVLDFGDGSRLNCKSYEVVSHTFVKPGIHIVTAECPSETMQIVSKLKVVVSK